MFKFSKTVLTLVLLSSVQMVASDERALTGAETVSSLLEKSLLLASDQYGRLSIVAGERGHIFYSYDTKHWIQASTDTKTTLTNVFILDDKLAWAVGHDAVILKSNDGAKTWQTVFSDIHEEAPLLDVYFEDALTGIAIGAYGLIYVTKNGGVNWQKASLNLSDESKEEDEFTDVNDLHLNSIASAGDKRYYIAAEAGNIFRSDDDGESWLRLPSPYRGSFFGVLPLSLNNVLVYGLRGHLYRSSDAGSSWVKVDSDTNEMLTDASYLANGDIVVVGLAGTMLISRDNGKTFSKINLNHRHGLSSISETVAGSMLLTGDAGIQLLLRDKTTPKH